MPRATSDMRRKCPVNRQPATGNCFLCLFPYPFYFIAVPACPVSLPCGIAKRYLFGGHQNVDKKPLTMFIYIFLGFLYQRVFLLPVILSLTTNDSHLPSQANALWNNNGSHATHLFSTGIVLRGYFSWSIADLYGDTPTICLL